MTKLELSTILEMIDQWVAQIPESELGEQCRKSGMDFFSYMTSREVNAGYLARLIMDTTGYNPRQLWTVQDANLLREAISRYEGSIAAAEQGMDPKQSARHFWGS